MSRTATKGCASASLDLVGRAVDDWPEGQNIAIKSLSARSVGRAADASGVVLICAQHNLRRGNGGHRHRSRIDPAKKPLNSVLEGGDCPDAVAALAASILAGFGLTYPARVDAVAAFELVIQPPSWGDTVEWWRAAMQWVHGKYQHVLSAVVHRDQRRPHGHVLVLAVVGGALAGRSLQRGGWAFRTLRASFGTHMASAAPMAAPRVDALTRLALTSGRGPKTRAEAARRDASSASALPLPENVRTLHEDIQPMSSCSQPNVHSCAVSRGAFGIEKGDAKDGFGMGGWCGWPSRELVMSAAACLA
jgi:hypothetical protein